MQLLTGHVLVVLAVLTLTVGVGGQETGYPTVLSKPFDQNIKLNVFSEADGQQIADNFQLAADETIGEITWFGGYNLSDVATVDRPFKLRIFDDSGGAPATDPFFEDIVSVAGVDTGFDNQDGKNIFQYTAVIVPVVLNAGTEYWVSVLENDKNTVTPNWFWQASNSVAGENAGFRSNDGDSWSTFADPTRNEMAFFLSAADSIPDPSTNLDHYLSYKVKRTEFEKLEVTLTDQFESDVLFEVKKPKEIYNVADKNGEGIINPDTHLVGYEIKRAKTKPRQPKHVKQTNIEVVNQFGTIFVDTKKPDRLLVPSLKDLDIPIPDIDVTDEFPVGHFKCYKVKTKKRICQDDPSVKCKSDADCTEAGLTGSCNLGFPKGVLASVVDQFNQSKLYDVKKPTRLCTPVGKNGEGFATPDEENGPHLMCYRVKQVKGICAEGSAQNVGGACKREEDCGGTKKITNLCVLQPKHVKVLGIHVNNQFGPEQLDTIKEEELCVPSTKTLPES